FTNAMAIVDRIRSESGVNFDLQFGSDFDGVSDDIEANVISMNYPFDTLYPTPAGAPVPKFLNLNADGRLSLRGNKMVGNNIAPFSYADGTGGRLATFTNYEALYMNTSASIIPTIDAGNIYPHLKGTFAAGIAPYTTIIIDVYWSDPEGWT